MKRALAGVLMLAAIGAAAWYAVGRQGERPAAADAGEARPSFDFEAEGVVLRQMDATGRLQYEVTAGRITQHSGGGAIEASNVTLHHDPRDATPGGAGRWTLTAPEALLPDGGGSVSLSGGVLAKGVPPGRSNQVQLTADRLHYDLGTEEFTTDVPVELVMGRYRARGGLLRGNVATNEWALESGVDVTRFR
jgi:LPS export ABC transporter protein LptC